jgi:hypothetical protein
MWSLKDSTVSRVIHAASAGVISALPISSSARWV